MRHLTTCFIAVLLLSSGLFAADMGSPFAVSTDPAGNSKKTFKLDSDTLKAFADDTRGLGESFKDFRAKVDGQSHNVSSSFKELMKELKGVRDGKDIDRKGFEDRMDKFSKHLQEMTKTLDASTKEFTQAWKVADIPEKKKQPDAFGKELGRFVRNISDLLNNQSTAPATPSAPQTSPAVTPPAHQTSPASQLDKKESFLDKLKHFWKNVKKFFGNLKEKGKELVKQGKETSTKGETFADKFKAFTKKLKKALAKKGANEKEVASADRATQPISEITSEGEAISKEVKELAKAAEERSDNIKDKFDSLWKKVKDIAKRTKNLGKADKKPETKDEKASWKDKWKKFTKDVKDIGKSGKSAGKDLKQIADDLKKASKKYGYNVDSVTRVGHTIDIELNRKDSVRLDLPW